MALSTVSEGATSAATDLNQVVNLLNGTTTNTQVTVNGPVGASMAGTAGYMRYVGGLPPVANNPLYDSFFTPGGLAVNAAPQAIPAGYQADGAAYYQNADLAWLPGGPLAIGAASLSSAFTSVAFGAGLPNQTQQLPPVTGMGGYAARIHQAGAVTISSSGGTQYVTGDTVDYDPRGMVQPSASNPGGIAIQLPFFGVWGFAFAVHSSGVGNMNTSWVLIVGNGNVAACPSIPSDNTHKYTGVSGCGFTAAGGGFQDLNSQIALLPLTPPASFNLDVSGPDRTYMAVWLVG